MDGTDQLKASEVPLLQRTPNRASVAVKVPSKAFISTFASVCRECQESEMGEIQSVVVGDACACVYVGGGASQGHNKINK